MEMILIPASEFSLGEGDDIHSVYVAAFYIAKYPLTNRLYQRFVDATKHPPPQSWVDNRHSEITSDHPVVDVSWYDALAYCDWLSETEELSYRLPTEAEWEKTARGVEGRIYPWGNDFEKERCNTWEGGMGRTTPVDNFPTGASPYGVMDLVGNVWEWCSSAYIDYPYQAADGREDLATDEWRVLRGGSWFDSDWGARPARRLGGQPNYASRNTGFRVAHEV